MLLIGTVMAATGSFIGTPISINDFRGHYDYNTGGHWSWLADASEGFISDNNKLGTQTSLTENGPMIPGVGFTPNRHDLLTGSQADGRAFPPGDDRCGNWTSAPRGARCSVTSIVRACATMPPHSHGTRRILREAPMAAAAKMTCAAPAVTGCSIVLLHDRPGAILTTRPQRPPPGPATVAERENPCRGQKHAQNKEADGDVIDGSHDVTPHANHCHRKGRS